MHGRKRVQWRRCSIELAGTAVDFAAIGFTLGDDIVRRIRGRIVFGKRVRVLWARAVLAACLGAFNN